MKLRFERYCHWITAVVAVGVWLAAKVDVPPNLSELLSVVVGMASIAAGFLFTTGSILLAIDKRWIIQRGKELGAYQNLIDYLLEATKWCLLLAVVSTAGVAFQVDCHASWVRWGFSCWLFLAVGSLVATVRVLRIFSIVLRAVSREK